MRSQIGPQTRKPIRLTYSENVMQTKTIGTREEAEFLAKNTWIDPDSPSTRLISYDALEKAGWERISFGSAYRTVFLSPSKTVYKVQQTGFWQRRGRSTRLDMNSKEVRNWKKLHKAGFGENVPEHQLFKIEVNAKTVEITAVEYLPYDSYRSVHDVDRTLYYNLSQYVGDLHGENLYWSKDKGVFVVVDAGNSADDE